MGSEGTALGPGAVLALDVVVYDKDADGSFSWVAWGPGTEKLLAAGRRGDVVLLDHREAPAQISGRIHWQGVPIRRGRAALRRVDAPDQWFGLVAGVDGSFAATAPPGRYLARAVGNREDVPPVLVEVGPGAARRLELELPPPRGQIVAATRTALPVGSGARRGLWHTYAEPDGLPHSSVSAIHEDRRGRLWFATQGGISRFDGETFTTFSTEGAVKASQIRCLLEDRAGDLWLGTDGGLRRFDGEKFTTFTTEDGLPDENVLSLLEDRAGNLWIGTTNGVGRFDGQTLQIYDTRDGLPGGQIACMLEDRDGQLWLGSARVSLDGGNGVARYDGGTFTTFTRRDGLPSDQILCLLEDPGGKVWLGTGDGVSRWDGKSFTTIATGRELGFGRVRDMLIDRYGSMWFATGNLGLAGQAEGGGLVRWDGKSFRRFTSADGLPGVLLQDLLEDRQGYLWLASDNGVARYDGGRFTYFTAAEGLGFAEAWSLLKDRQGGCGSAASAAWTTGTAGG